MTYYRSTETLGVWEKGQTTTGDVAYRKAVRNNIVPLPWREIDTSKAAKTVDWLMGQFDLSTGPNPKMIVNNYNMFAEMANDRPALYVVTDQTMTGSPLWDATRGALRIEGTNRLAYASDEYAVFAGMAQDIDGSAIKIDATWQIKVWYDGFVESQCTLHPRDGVEYTIRWMWVEMKFNHEQLKYLAAPFSGHARGLCRAHTDEGFSWVETDMVDSAIKRWRTWTGAGQNWVVGERCLYLGKTYECIQAHGPSQNPSTQTAYWSLSASGYGVEPFNFDTYSPNYPSPLGKLHLWMGSAVNNAGAGTGSPTPLYNSYAVATYKTSLLDPGSYDSEGGLQEPWFQFFNCGEGDRNAHSDKGFWFGLESDANHRNAKACSSEGNRGPKVHMFFDDAGSKVATVRIDFIGSTGVESNPTSFSANNNAQNKIRWDEDAGYNVAKATTNAPLRFEWFWHALPTKPRNSTDWKRFRMAGRWTVEAINYGSGTFEGDLPSQHSHTPMSTKPMLQLMWNYLEWTRRGYIMPDFDVYDQHVTADSADPMYARWAKHFRNPAKDLGAKTMPNITLMHAISCMSTNSGFWPPTIGGAESHRRYPIHPLMDPYAMFSIARLETGKVQLRQGEVAMDFDSTNKPLGIEHNWGHPIVRQYLAEEVWHALQNEDIGAIYYDNFNVTRTDHPNLEQFRWFAKPRVDTGGTGSGTAKLDVASTGGTYTTLQANLTGIKNSGAQAGLGGADCWGESYTYWPIRENRETVREIYRMHEAAGKPMVAHHFGAHCPPLDSHTHYLVFGEELVGGLGVGSVETRRAANTLAFVPRANPYDFLPDTYWLACWSVGSAPLFLPQFGRMISDYRPHCHTDAAWNSLLAKLHQFEVGLAGVGFYVSDAYNAANAYVIDSYVAYQGKVYLCKQAHGPSPSRLPTDTAYWVEIGNQDCNPSQIHAWWDDPTTWRA